ncbi:MAG: hypothetical protein IJU25_04460 [Lachnospiraceae bacterium]|nr:hypothetical protein [Lachnospiraceae bacterium]
MGTEIKNKAFIGFSLRFVAGLLLAAVLVTGTNTLIDASQIIHKDLYPQMAKLALAGNTVTTPGNYDERRYQLSVIDEMQEVPETIVAGSSRGMFLGTDVTGFDDIYNHCVSGAVIEDDYAILGLYEEKFGKLPGRVILELSPWFFCGDFSEQRWLENEAYADAAIRMYEKINGRAPGEGGLGMGEETEDPYLSLSYFQYNLNVLKQKGWRAFGDTAKVSTDPDEAADLPDGTIRYAAASEHASKERLAKVQAAKGAVTYRGLGDAEGPDPEKCKEFENLVQYLLAQGCEVIFYLSPYSATQSRYIFDENLNPAIVKVQAYLRDYGRSKGIPVAGGYDARESGLTDESFIDYMHADREGNRIVWECLGPGEQTDER